MELAISRKSGGRRVYLDANATTPILPKALAALTEASKNAWGNPSAQYEEGLASKYQLDWARAVFANLMGPVDPETVHFTSCGTESNNIALRSVMHRRMSANPNHNVIVTSAVEHPSVKRTAASIEGGIHVQLRVDRRGYVDESHLVETLQRYGRRVAMVSIIIAQNEVGTLQPIPRFCAIVHRMCPEAVFHTDATQVFGKDFVEPIRLGDIDMLTASAHKFHGPRGVGLLYAKKGLIDAHVTTMTGGGQELGCRSGTENVAAIVAAAVALKASIGDESTWHERFRRTVENRNMIMDHLLKAVPGIHVNGDPQHGLYNTLSVSFPKVHGHALAEYLDKHGVSVGSGSACSKGKPSETMQAIYGPSEEATALIHNTLRISLTQYTTREECDFAAEQIVNAWRSLLPAT